MGKLSVKCRGKKIELFFTECDSLSDALLLLQKKKSFFRGSKMLITYFGIGFSYNEEMTFEKEIKSLFGEEAMLDKKHRLSKRQIEYSLLPEEKICTVVNKSLRSGDIVESRGDVLIYGDVNPGAIVKANGNITVIGAFRGNAHVVGNGKVYATYMNPGQIIIGKVCSYNKKTENVDSAVAIAENGEIILQRL